MNNHPQTMSSSIFRFAALVLCVVFVGSNVGIGTAADGPPAGKSKGPLIEQAAALRMALLSPDPAVRVEAVRALPHNAAARLLRPELLAALKDSNGEVREWAATVLGPQGADAVDAVTQLIVQLQSDSVNKARETAARALGRIGKATPTERRAIPALEKAATDDADSVVRVVALGALALIEPDSRARIDAVAAYLTHADPLTRMKAAHSLGYLMEKAQSSGPAIARVLQQATDPYQRGYVARSLGQIGAKDQLPILLAEFDNETDPRSQGEMRGAIRRLGGVLPKTTAPNPTTPKPNTP